MVRNVAAIPSAQRSLLNGSLDIMNTLLRILHLEDDWHDAELIRRILLAEGLSREVVSADTGETFLAALCEREFDCILSDYTLPSFDGMRALKLARDRRPGTPFIFVSGTIDEELAVESLKQGATDYIFKNRLSRLGPAVRRALRDQQERNESQRAEEAMRQSEHKYRQLFESLGDAAFLTDVQTGRILDTNKQGEALLGRSRSEIVGKNQSQFQSPEIFEEHRRRFVAENGQTSTMDYEDEIVRADGARVPVQVRVSPLILYGRKLLIGLYHDITGHKLAAEQIQEQARLLDLDPDAILVRDMEDRIQFWNEGAVRLYGWTKDEILGRPATELLYPDHGEFEAAKKTVMEQGAWSGDLHQVAKDGHEVRVHSRWTLMRTEQGKPKSILLVNTDLTEIESNRLATRVGAAEVNVGNRRRFGG
ncbi:MAG: putative sensor protein [Pedosphaera sp.]|nr:putative sensor protein [Pedosphaera sp.]